MEFWYLFTVVMVVMIVTVATRRLEILFWEFMREEGSLEVGWISLMNITICRWGNEFKIHLKLARFNILIKRLRDILFDIEKNILRQKYFPTESLDLKKKKIVRLSACNSVLRSREHHACSNVNAKTTRLPIFARIEFYTIAICSITGRESVSSI